MATSNEHNESPGSWLWGPYSRLAGLVALPMLIIDQAQKWWMLAGLGMKEGQGFVILPFFNIVYVKNTGISYSLFDSDAQSWQNTLAAFAFAVSIALWVWIARGATSRLMAISLALIISGAVGNAIDRLLIGGVADFFQLHGFGYSWYIFNIADAAIVAGVIGLLYDSFVPSRNHAAKAS